MIKNDYILIEKQPTSNETIVIFSAVDCKKGEFHSVKALKQLNVNKIFINCENNSWYFDGIPKLGNNWEESSRLLYQEALSLTSTKNGNVLYFGGSMGGTGALLYGLHQNVNKIISTGSEAIFFEKGSYSAHKFNGTSRIQPTWDAFIENYSGELLMIYGDLEAVDKKAFETFSLINDKFKNSIKIIKNYGHRIPVYLAEKYGIKEFINDALNTPLNQINIVKNDDQN